MKKRILFLIAILFYLLVVNQESFDNKKFVCDQDFNGDFIVPNKTNPIKNEI